MSAINLQKKRMLIQIIGPDKKVNQQFYVEKSVLVQLWEKARPFILFVGGVIIGMVIG